MDSKVRRRSSATALITRYMDTAANRLKWYGDKFFRPSNRRMVVLTFFGLLLIVGFRIYGDYGVSWDERDDRQNGIVTYTYVRKLISPSFPVPPSVSPLDIHNALATYHARHYGMMFETPAYAIEQLLGITDIGAQFRFRHLLTFLVCFAGIAAFYKLATRRFMDWRIGLLGSAWMVLSPRLFAEYFYNDKDAVFMAAMVIAINTMVLFLLKPSISSALLHSVASAAAIDIRVMGVLIPAATALVLIIRMCRREVPYGRGVLPGLIYLCCTAALVIAFWPYLWTSPWVRFREAFLNMSKYPWSGIVLYRGARISAPNLPWHYPFTWIAITTPLLYLGSFVAGVFAVGRQIVRRKWRLWEDDAEMQDVVFLGLFAAPLGVVFILHSVLYDGWRQLYFVYPPFILLGLRGWDSMRWLTARRRPRSLWNIGFGMLTAACLFLTLSQIIHAHPFQNVYMNVLAGKHRPQNYELDYWDLSYRRGLECIAAKDNRDRIKVCAAHSLPAWENLQMLPAETRDRIDLVSDIEGADYYLTTHRSGDDVPSRTHEEVCRVNAFGARVLSVFRLL